MSFETISVNEPYPFQLPSAEGAISDFLRPGSNRLLIAIHGITKDEEKALRKGQLRCGLLAKNGAILFLWQFRNNRNDPIFTLDSPFDARLINDIQFYDVKSTETRVNVDVHVVDMSTQLVRALRSITMPPGLSLEFLSAVQDQLASHEAGKEQMQRWMRKEPYELSKQTQMWLMGK